MPVKQAITNQRVPVKIWTDDVDDRSKEQLANIASMPFIHHHVAAMTDEITLPSRLVCLGEAMAPVLGKLDAALSEQSQPTVPVGSIVDVIKEGL